MSQMNEARAPRRFQFSLVMLLALTGWAAIVCLALKTPTPIWAAVVFLLTFVAALAGGLGIIYRTGRARVFAVGFFSGCLSYAACLFITEKQIGGDQQAVGQTANVSEMPTTAFANWLFDRMHPESASMMGGMMGGGMGGGFGGGGAGGGMGGGGFFSVDSSLSADQGSAHDSDATDTQPALAQLSPSDSDGIDQVAPPGSGVLVGPATPATPVFTIYYFQEFVVIVHSALATLLGLAGGVIAQIFYAARREPADER
jgi:hypothetical protein